LDALMIRHPLAQGLLTIKAAVLWTAAWSIIALIGAYFLNPFCIVVFLGAALLETIYCLLWNTSPFRTLVSGAVKTAGPMAAAFAVDPHPSPSFLVLLFLWLFFWEIGGQNVPNDWTDLEEDRSFKAKTIPVRFGTEWAKAIIILSLIMAVVLNGLLMGFSRIGGAVLARLFSLGAGLFLLLIPGYRLLKVGGRPQALILFNRASYYPLTLLTINGLLLIFSEYRY
jgi:4-hydroxybenzoate polyprenyltransferase